MAVCLESTAEFDKGAFMWVRAFNPKLTCEKAYTAVQLTGLGSAPVLLQTALEL